MAQQGDFKKFTRETYRKKPDETIKKMKHNISFIVEQLYDFIIDLKSEGKCYDCCIKCDFVSDCYSNIERKVKNVSKR